MTTMNISVDMPLHPRFNVDQFRDKVQEFATSLMALMTKESAPVHDTQKVMTQDEALSFIQSLAVKGGEVVPEDINPIECLVEENYEA